MIAFFRKIRQKLLNENRFSKYLLYAVGEIFLIVFGIMIALQLNNWNEEKRLQKDTDRYLVKLHQDLLGIQKLYEYDDPDSWPQQALDALKYVESCGTADSLKQSFVQMLKDHQGIPSYRVNRSTYDEMISTGALTRIPSDSLKNAILDFFNIVEFQQSHISYFQNEVGLSSMVIKEHVLFSYSDKKQPELSYQIDELCTKIVFKNALVEVADARLDWIQGYEEILNQLEITLEMLEAHLKHNIN